MALGNWTKGQTVSIVYGIYDTYHSGTYLVLEDVNLDKFMLELARDNGDSVYGIEQYLMDAGIIKCVPVTSTLDLGADMEIASANTDHGDIDKSKVIAAVYGERGKVSTWGDMLDALEG